TKEEAKASLRRRNLLRVTEKVYKTTKYYVVSWLSVL
ncbi:MAG: hypothetical protein ACI959_000684, partial [Limisphaerales bacterium]